MEHSIAPRLEVMADQQTIGNLIDTLVEHIIQSLLTPEDFKTILLLEATSRRYRTIVHENDEMFSCLNDLTLLKRCSVHHLLSDDDLRMIRTLQTSFVLPSSVTSVEKVCSCGVDICEFCYGRMYRTDDWQCTRCGCFKCKNCLKNKAN